MHHARLAIGTVLLLLAGAVAQDLDTCADLSGLPPELSWVRDEGFRMGYNHAASLDWYPRAKAWGMNGIISRLEIANDPSGDEALDAQFPPGATAPWALQSWRMVPRSSRAAKENGLRFFYMLNLGAAGYNISDGFRDNPRRFNNGALFSPVDEIYWTRVVENRFLRVANVLRGDEYQIDGFLIDPEMYSEQGAIPGGVDYGDYALSEFVRETGVALAYEGLDIPARRRLVEDQGLYERLYAFEFQRLKSLAESTRRKVQVIHPRAIMGFFLWENALWFKAVAAGFSTPEIPCWVGPESTYPGSYDDELLGYVRNVRKQAGVPILLVPGLRLGYEDGAVPREFLSVLPGNLYHRSIATEGYWFWSLARLGATDEARAPFRAVLETVNAELTRYHASGGMHVSELKPAPLPVNQPRNLQELLTQARGWEPVSRDALPSPVPEPTGIALRTSSAYAIAIPAQQGETLSLRVGNIRLGSYTAPTACIFYRPDGSSAGSHQIALGTSATVTQIADQAGIWVVGASAHNNAFWVLPETQRAVIASSGGFAMCKAPPGRVNRCFFYVPETCREFGLEMWASPGERASFRVYNAAGELVCDRPQLGEKSVVRLQTGELAGKVWWLESSEAVEDHGFSFVDIPGIIAARADQLLAPAR